MKGTSFAAVFVAAIVGNVAAYPQLAEKLSLDKRQDDHAWIAPGAGDARTACPGCNTLANHGYINRNGRDITAQQLQQGFLDAFGFDFAVTAAGAQNAVNLQNNGQGTFDLDTMNQPHQIEHDASLSRNDLEMEWNQDANNFAFNATVWCETQQLYGGGDHVDALAANTARMGRIAQAQQEDFPGWFVENDGGSLAEAGFYLTSMDDPTVDGISARLDWLNYWISNERLPTELGWVKPAISNDEFNSVVAAVSNAGTTVPPTGAASCGAPTATPSSSSMSSGSSPVAYSPTYTSLSSSAYPTAPPFSNNTMSSPGGYATKTPGSGSGNTTPVPMVTPTPGAPSVPEVPSSVTSSAKGVATGLAGPAPAVPNGYKQVLSKDQWNQVSSIVTVYVTKVEQIILSLCGLQGMSSVSMPGVSGSPAGGAPWYGSMGSGASGAAPSAGAPATNAGSALGGAATCACN